MKRVAITIEMFFRENSIYFATDTAIYELERECLLKTRYEIELNCDKIELFAANQSCSYFAISIVHVTQQTTKQLVVLNDNWVPIRNLKLNRAANWIGFIADDIILFVDKNGEVFRFEIITETLVKLFGNFFFNYTDSHHTDKGSIPSVTPSSC